MNRARLSTHGGLTRRAFLGAAAGALALGVPLSSCRRRPSPNECVVQLNWILDAEYAGSYVAIERRYYTARGVTTVLVPGGPNVAVPVRVVSRDALIGISSPDLVAAANAQGADLRIVGAVYQKSPFAIMSLVRTPIRTPGDMLGKRVGVQAKDDVLWRAFLAVNRLPPERITRVVAGFDPAPLVSGEVDAWLSYATNEPLALSLQGVETVTFLLHDHGYPMLQQVYVTAARNLLDPATRATLVGFLGGDIAGWRDALAEPDIGARLAVDKFGHDLGLDPRHQRLLARKQIDFIRSEDTRREGLLWMSDSAIGATLASLRAGGVTLERPVFTRELLDEVYAHEPGLREA